jgi:hypothetical protein
VGLGGSQGALVAHGDEAGEPQHEGGDAGCSPSLRMAMTATLVMTTAGA